MSKPAVSIDGAAQHVGVQERVGERMVLREGAVDSRLGSSIEAWTTSAVGW